MDSVIKTLIQDNLGDNYQGVVLFGSQARDDFNRQSDYDLLVITKRNLAIKNKMMLSSQWRREFARRGIDADILIKSRREIREQKEKIGSLVRIALQEGKSL